ncbi:hypothetical protein GTA09_14450, partial [Rhodococcus hoagii]|nr:hypothetical protein [Prescottella equi]
GKFQILDDQINRNDVSYIDQQTTQLTNTIVRKLNDAPLAAIEEHIGAENTLAGHNCRTCHGRPRGGSDPELGAPVR